MGVYVLVTTSETDDTAYLESIKEYWQELHPQMTMSSQRLSDQFRMKKKILSSDETKYIKEIVSERLGI